MRTTFPHHRFPDEFILMPLSTRKTRLGNRPMRRLDGAPTLRFRAPIKIRGINPYVLVSAKQAVRLKPGWRKPMPVRVQINGKLSLPWRINLMPVGDGSFYLYLHGQVRKESGTNVGDLVNVEIEFNGEYQGGPVNPMPPWFGQDLRRNSAAQRGWNSLPPRIRSGCAALL